MRKPSLLLSLVSLIALTQTVSAAIVGKHAVAIRGQLMCGSVPAENVKVRLFRVKQQKKDDLNQILAETTTGKPGVFLLEGNTNGFPLNETTMQPVVSFYHSCDEDPAKVKKNGYRKFNYNIPTEYVAMGSKPKRTYDFGTLNIQLEFPGEKHDKKFEERKIARL
ncbi:Transthyretin-like family protein [Ancylostoma caninum]|uniref:Transthyretin-like family protein n=1 Tax=Ancylostoma caninum TaxID=29170 RepID=A0A368GEI4_ANCCA|nr:Transthyretin-like family protein [Ancylostoma caninum]RCN42813.1 Transthyretin-like family protein [Ancylostoma caninum]